MVKLFNRFTMIGCRLLIAELTLISVICTIYGNSFATQHSVSSSKTTPASLSTAKSATKSSKSPSKAATPTTTTTKTATSSLSTAASSSTASKSTQLAPVASTKYSISMRSNAYDPEFGQSSRYHSKSSLGGGGGGGGLGSSHGHYHGSGGGGHGPSGGSGRYQYSSAYGNDNPSASANSPYGTNDDYECNYPGHCPADNLDEFNHCVKCLKMSDYSNYLACQTNYTMEMTEMNDMGMMNGRPMMMMRRTGVKHCCALQTFLNCVIPVLFRNCQSCALQQLVKHHRPHLELCHLVLNNPMACEMEMTQAQNQNQEQRMFM